jgi:curved DNA-binding protein CbpA
MTETHYSALGVEPDAGAADIKRAYYTKANETHPDKGGKAEDFAAVALAYEVLSDPQRRLLYDVTGEDSRTPIEVEVQKVLLNGFGHALNSDEDIEMVAFVRDGLHESEKQAAAAIKNLEERQEKLEAKRGKVVSTGTNVLHMIIDKELKNIAAETAHIEHQREVIKAALTALDEYSEEKPEPKPYGSVDYRRMFIQ